MSADEPGRASATAAVQAELVVLLRRARSWFAQTAREVHPDLEPGAYALLSLVHSGQAATVTEIADRLSVGKPTISRQVTALEELELLHRSSAPDDRRVVQLQLTDKGRSRLDQARARREERFRALLADWSVDDLTTLAALLQRLNTLDSGAGTSPPS